MGGEENSGAEIQEQINGMNIRPHTLDGRISDERYLVGIKPHIGPGGGTQPGSGDESLNFIESLTPPRYRTASHSY